MINLFAATFVATTAATVAIGADSMGSIAATAKQLWGRYPKVATQEFCYFAVVHSQMVR